MGSWFKGLALGVAALLGLSKAAVAPELSLRAYRDASSLYASAEIEELAGTDLERLVEAAFLVRVHASFWAGPARAEAHRDIRFDGIRYEVRVSETGGVHRTEDAGAAWAIASRFTRIRLGDVAALRFPIAMGCKVTLRLPEDEGYDPMVVWGYKAAAAYREIDSVGLVPYY
jgi:hypothetical protein